MRCSRARWFAAVLILPLGFSACQPDQNADNNSPAADVSDASDVGTEDVGDTSVTADHEDLTDTEDGAVDVSGDAGEDANSPYSVSVCLNPCDSPDDCGNDGDPLYNPAHYACESGACIFEGCNTDAECEQSLGDAYGCDDSMDPPSCVATCSTVDDCTAEDSLNDANNYECETGFCRFLGCLNDQECVDARGEGSVCVNAADHPTSSVGVCADSCSTVSDCGSAADLYGEDNYQCSGGGCIWTGCNSSEECNGLVDRGLICG